MSLTGQPRLAVILLIICLLPLSRACKPKEVPPELPLLEDDYDDDDTVFVAEPGQLLEMSAGDLKDSSGLDYLHAPFLTDENRLEIQS